MVYIIASTSWAHFATSSAPSHCFRCIFNSNTFHPLACASKLIDECAYAHEGAKIQSMCRCRVQREALQRMLREPANAAFWRPRFSLRSLQSSQAPAGRFYCCVKQGNQSILIENACARRVRYFFRCVARDKSGENNSEWCHPRRLRRQCTRRCAQKDHQCLIQHLLARGCKAAMRAMSTAGKARSGGHERIGEKSARTSFREMSEL